MYFASIPSTAELWGYGASTARGPPLASASIEFLSLAGGADLPRHRRIDDSAGLPTRLCGQTVDLQPKGVVFLRDRGEWRYLATGLAQIYVAD